MTDGQTGKPVAGATLDAGSNVITFGPSNSNGRVSVAFRVISVHQVKALKSGSIRSNQITIQVV